MGYRNGNAVTQVLGEVSFSCQSGELIGVAGLNGSGKSTLLKSVAGLVPLLSGSIELEGQPLNEMPLNEVAKKVSVVLTDKISGFNMTTFDAVAAGQLPYTNAFHSLEPRHLEVIEQVIDVTGLRPYRNRLLSELSDGLYQKTMIARALAQKTSVILLDEPNAYLDYGSKHALFILLKRLCNDERKCVLLSTHDLDLIIKYCDKVLLVAGGKAELVSVEEVKQHRSFIEIGGGYI
jgi:iron complex transport system ATP-binding protein